MRAARIITTLIDRSSGYTLIAWRCLIEIEVASTERKSYSLQVAPILFPFPEFELICTGNLGMRAA